MAKKRINSSKVTQTTVTNLWMLTLQSTIKFVANSVSVGLIAVERN